jgi:hypothetical protein
MVTEEDVRRVVLSLPGSLERPYDRLRLFRVRSNLFLRIHELPDAFFVRCASAEERNELLRAETTNCSGPSYASCSSRLTTTATWGFLALPSDCSPPTTPSTPLDRERLEPDALSWINRRTAAIEGVHS